jgi:hypothetical protein
MSENIFDHSDRAKISRDSGMSAVGVHQLLDGHLVMDPQDRSELLGYILFLLRQLPPNTPARVKATGPSRRVFRITNLRGNASQFGSAS